MSGLECRGRVVIVQPQVAQYRRPVFAALAKLLPWPLAVVHGTAEAQDSLPDSALDGGIAMRAIPWSRCRRGGVRQLSLRAVLAPFWRQRPAAVVMSANINYLAAHALLLFCRWRRIPLVGWSQLKRAGYRRRAVFVKTIWLRAFPVRLLYTDRERHEGIARGMPPATTWSARNGLDRRLASTVRDEPVVARQGPFVFCARLEAKNRCDLLVDAFAAYRTAGGQRSLTVIGDGRELATLQDRARAAGCATVIEWLGACYDEEWVAGRMATAYAMVHPFGIGLSLVTAMMVGCPVICCRDRREHMPEHWLWTDELTGWGFDRGVDAATTVTALAAALQQADAVPLARYAEIRRRCRRRTELADAERMARRMAGALRQAVARSGRGRLARSRVTAR